MRTTLLAPLLILAAAPLLAHPPQANSLLGIHWYPNTDALSIGEMTDVEAMVDNTGIWITEITHLDEAATAAAPWLGPGYALGHAQKALSAKGHGLIYRIQPFWDCNVPHPEDPFTVEDFAREAGEAAVLLRDWVGIYQVGNEVNVINENRRWNSASSNYSGATWQPTPAQYAATYEAVRDEIHAQAAALGFTPLVLMQPVSPGPVDAARYYDGYEFLFRQIDAVQDKSKIDGFALHGYAEPGGSNFGVDGFFDSIRAQLMIIHHFGLGDRPVFITEFNKHMPNAANANIAAGFVTASYAKLDDWNNTDGGDGPFPGATSNQNIVGATWFVYPEGGWNDYSLLYWKDEIASTAPTANPWYAFNEAAQQNYAAGAYGGGSSSGFPADEIWYLDDFTTLDTSPGFPDWRVAATGSGSAAASSGQLRLLGNNSTAGGASVYSSGYMFGDFSAEINLVLTNANRASTNVNEANFEVRLRENTQGYSLAFFTDQSPANAGRVVLRRVNNWGETIGGFNRQMPGGIASNDEFTIRIQAQGERLRFEVQRTGESLPSIYEIVDDGGQRTGQLRIGTYNLNELRINDIKIGGPAYVPFSTPTPAANWKLY